MRKLWRLLHRFRKLLKNRKFLFAYVPLVLLSLALPLVIVVSQRKQQTKQYAATLSLPGEQIWNNGVSSYVFGTNNTNLWAADNIETDTTVQQTMKNAHVPLIRTWFFDCATSESNTCTTPDGLRYDSNSQEIERRLKTDETIGAACLGVLANPDDVAFNQQVVSYAGNRCNMYEFGNEPDGNMTDYINQWNTQIPQLRKLNPSALFIGPVASNYSTVQQFLTAVKSSGVLPDAVTWHLYPCWQQNATSCMTTALTEFTNEINTIRQEVTTTLGKSLPLGITEWNVDPGSSQMATLMRNASFVQQFTSTALQEMIQANLDFANQFTAENYAGYGALDMFDSQNGGAPKPQWTTFANLIAQYYSPNAITATTAPTNTPTQMPAATTAPTPTHASLPTPTNTPPSQPAPYILYDDRLSANWSDSSWGASVNYANTSPVYSGSDSIAFTATGSYAGLSFYNGAGVSTAPYTSLQLYMQASQANQAYGVMLYSTAWLTYPLPLSNYGGNLVPGGWIKYTIPLTALKANGITVRGLAITSLSSTAQPVVYVDDIAFVH